MLFFKKEEFNSVKIKQEVGFASPSSISDSSCDNGYVNLLNTKSFIRLYGVLQCKRLLVYCVLYVLNPDDI